KASTAACGFCRVFFQSDRGVAAPTSEQFDILGLADLTVGALPGGRGFVPLVSMREFGGLVALPDRAGVFLLNGSDVELYAPTFREALEKLGREHGNV